MKTLRALALVDVAVVALSLVSHIFVSRDASAAVNTIVSSAPTSAGGALSANALTNNDTRAVVFKDSLGVSNFVEIGQDLFVGNGLEVGGLTIAFTALTTNGLIYVGAGGILRTAALSGLTFSGGILTATASAGGNSGHLQFNQSGALAGTNDARFDRTNRILYVPQVTVTNNGGGAAAILGANTLRSLAGSPSDFSIINSDDAEIVIAPNNSSRWRFTGSSGSHALIPSSTAVYDIGRSDFTTRSNYAVAFKAYDSVYLTYTGTERGGLAFRLLNAYRTTNILDFSITNPVAGHIPRFTAVSTANGVSTIIVTNIPENAMPTALLSGLGGALTNFTLTADMTHRYATGQTNVSVRAIMGTVPGLPMCQKLVITNWTGTDRTLEFSPVTNNFFFSGVYGTNAPTTITNGHRMEIWFECDGTNASVTYAYFPKRI